MPLFLGGLVISSLSIANTHWFYALALAGQFGFYAIALIAHVYPAFLNLSPVRIVYFFCQANLAIVQAGAQYLFGTRMTTWQPSAR